MTTVRAHLREVLTKAEGLESLSAVYSGRAAQGAQLPYLMLHLTHQTRETDLLDFTGDIETQVQIDCVAVTAEEAETIGKAVVFALQRYNGIHGNNKIAQIEIADELLDTWSDDVGLSRWIVDIDVSHSFLGKE